MLVRTSLRRSLATLAAAAVVTTGLAVASPAQASSSVIWMGFYNSKSQCLSMQGAYSHGTKIVYPCYQMTQTSGWIFGYTTR